MHTKVKTTWLNNELQSERRAYVNHSDEKETNCIQTRETTNGLTFRWRCFRQTAFWKRIHSVLGDKNDYSSMRKMAYYHTGWCH